MCLCSSVEHVLHVHHHTAGRANVLLCLLCCSTRGCCCTVPMLIVKLCTCRGCYFHHLHSCLLAPASHYITWQLLMWHVVGLCSCGTALHPSACPGPTHRCMYRGK